MKDKNETSTAGACPPVPYVCVVGDFSGTEIRSDDGSVWPISNYIMFGVERVIALLERTRKGDWRYVRLMKFTDN